MYHFTLIHADDEESDWQNVCRKCGEFYPDGGDGDNGFCPSCADDKFGENVEDEEVLADTRNVYCFEDGDNEIATLTIGEMLTANMTGECKLALPHIERGEVVRFLRLKS